MPEIEETSERCPLCGGRGWVVAADGGAGSARACACREQDRTQRLVDAAGIPPRYRHCKLSSFQISSALPQMRDQLSQARAVAARYADDFLQPNGRFRESGLLFVGPPGVGKTHLAVGVLVELIERYRVHARFSEFTSLIHQIQATFDPGSPESKREILDPLVGAELLVLDELGAQQPTPWVRDILYLIINHRYTHRLPTIFTTNYLLEPPQAARPKLRGLERGMERGLDRGPDRSQDRGLDRGRDPEPSLPETSLLTSRLPAMLVSRLYEMAQPVPLTTVEDFRREHKVHGAYQR